MISRDQTAVISALLGREVARGLATVDAELLQNFATYSFAVRGLKLSTMDSYTKVLARWHRWCRTEQIDPREPAEPDIESWLTVLFLVHRAGPEYRSKAIAAVRTFYTWLLRGKLNPAVGVRVPRVPRRAARKFKTDELRAIFATCDRSTDAGRRNFAILLFLYATGARRAELVGLNLEHLDLGERVGTVRFFGKGSKERVVSFEGEAVVALREWLLTRDRLNCADDAVFVTLAKNARRIGYSLPDLVLRGAITAANMRRTAGVHRMRSTCASDLHDAGVDLEVIRAFLGHEAVETTRRYLAISDRTQRTRMPADRLRAVLGKGPAIPRWANRPGVAAAVLSGR